MVGRDASDLLGSLSCDFSGNLVHAYESNLGGLIETGFGLGNFGIVTGAIIGNCGCKTRLGGITKQGDAYLRMLLVQGAKAAIHRSKPRQERVWLWVQQLSERVGWQKAAVALAAKNARILWAMFTRGQPYAANHVSIKPA